MRPAWLIGGAAALATALSAYLLYRARKTSKRTVASIATEPATTTPATPATPVANPATPAADAAASTIPLALGTAVRMTGLQSKPELNGQRGRIIGWDEAKGRLIVALSNGGGKSLQVKPANVVPATGSVSVEEMCAGDLLELTLAKHESLTTPHAKQLTKLLQSTSHPLDAGSLLRCAVSCEWFVTTLQHPDTGEMKVEPVQHAQLGAGVILFSNKERCVQCGEVLSPPEAGARRVALKVFGHKLCQQPSLEALVADGIKFLGLDRHGGEGANSRLAFETTDMTILSEQHFPSLMHMASALALEAGLSSLRLPSPSADGSPAAEHLRAFTNHTFFCFNASVDANAILPITAMHEGATYMLVYTCEMVLEAARGVLDDLGAFKAANKGSNKRVPSGPLPASYVLGALTQPGASFAGVHVNEFVAGIADDYKLTALSTAEVVAAFEAVKSGTVV